MITSSTAYSTISVPK